MSKKAELVNPAELKSLIKKLNLADEKKDYLEARWLTYVLWWDSRARTNKGKYYTSRSLVMIGGALIPALVGLREVITLEGYETFFTILTVVVSLMIAISAGTEEIFHFGEIWRAKRDAAEVLKIEGFRYFQLTGAYKGETHETAYPVFAEVVENLIEGEIKVYILAVMPKDESNKSETAGKKTSGAATT